MARSLLLFATIIPINAVFAAGSVSVGGNSYNLPYTCSSEGETYTISGAMSQTLTVSCNCTLVFDGITEWKTGDKTEVDLVKIEDGREVAIKLKGSNLMNTAKNYVTGIYVGAGSILNITNLEENASLTLEITGTGSSAIGGSHNGKGGSGTINIWGGTITATSGSNGAGIGGHKGSNGTVNIYGGTVTATGGEYGAGIGGGGEDAAYSGGTVNIYGGTVSAQGGERAAGIGGGNKGSGGTLSVYGGMVTAIAKGAKVDGAWQYAGAAIGGGYKGNGGEVRVYGGKVYAYAKTNDEVKGGESAGIGGGDGGGNGGIVKVYGGYVKAEGGEHAAGIGGGSGGNPGEFYNYGGTVDAVAGDSSYDKDHEADIGNGRHSSTTLTKSNMPFVLAGGSTKLAYSKATGIYGMGNPTNALGQAVYMVELDCGNVGREVEFAGLDGFGQTLLQADEYGKLYIWLPEGEYSFHELPQDTPLAQYAYTGTVSPSAATNYFTRMEWSRPAYGAGAMEIIETQIDGNGVKTVLSRPGVMEINSVDFDLAEIGTDAQTGVFGFRAELPADLNLKTWADGTIKNGKFKILKSYTLDGFNTPGGYETVEVGEASCDESGLVVLKGLINSPEDEGRRVVLFKIAVEE